MKGRSLSIAWYWLRANFMRRWSNFLVITLLIGLVGGVAIGALGAARRTQSSFNDFLASSNPSDMSVLLAGPNLTKDLARLPEVRHVAGVQFYLVGFPAGRHDEPVINGPIANGTVATVGSLGAEYFGQDKPAVIQGRMANPRKPDEFVSTAAAEKLMGWHVGQSIPMYFYSIAQASQNDFGVGTKVKPTLRITEHLVGTVVLNSQVVLDEVDKYPTIVIFTPAITDPLVAPSGNYIEYYLPLDHGASSVSKVEREIINALPKGTTYNFHVTSIATQQVNHSIEPEAIALAVFGLIAALAALVIAGGLLARTLSSDEGDFGVLRALGASPRTVAAAGLIGTLGAVIAGAVLAVLVGVLLSPLGPIGPVRSVYPHGIGFDWTVLGSAFAFFVLAIGGVATFLSLRQSRRYARRKRPFIVPAASRFATVLARAGLALTAVVGVRFALEPGRDRDAVPVRSALVGAALAVTIVVTTLTFGSGLATLISRPSLYGWNWNYAITGGEDVPPQSTSLLNRDPLVAAWSSESFANVQIDGVTVPALIAKPHAKVAPPLISGHELDATNQIVLGAQTMAELHKRVGDTVMGSYGAPQDSPVYVPPTPLVIVGTATFPAVGPALSLHPSMGVGAIIPEGIQSAAMKKFLSQPYATLNGPKIALVRFRKGVSAAAGKASLEKIVAVGNKAFMDVPNGAAVGDSIELLGVQYPAEIENYRTIGATPAVLALALAAGAVVALGITLSASVRRRRRDLAMLRALGFKSRQLRSAVAWQASVNGLVGVVVGVPVGIVLGRWLWTLFARTIDAVPEPTVPALSIVIVVLVTMALVNVMAALPGRSAARTSTAQVLRGE
jgi:hypothetical protein